MQQLYGLGVARHGRQLKRITSSVVAMEQGPSVEEQLHHPCVSLLGGDVQRRHASTIALVDDEGTLLRVQQLAHRVVAAIAGGKVQRTLVVVVLEIDAGPQPDEVLQRADVPVPAGIVQRRAAHAVLLVEQQLELVMGLAIGHLLGKVRQPAAIHDDKVENIPSSSVLDTDAGAQTDEQVDWEMREKSLKSSIKLSKVPRRVTCLPATPRSCQKQWRAVLLVQGVNVRALGHQIGHNVRMIEHGGAVQRRHLLHVRAAQADALLHGLHLKHQLHYVNGALGKYEKEK